MTASPTWPWSLLLLTRRRSPRSRAAAWRGRSRWGSTPIVVPRSSRPSRLADTTPGDDGTQHAMDCSGPVSYTHLRAHETDSYLVCRLLLEKKKKQKKKQE